MKDEFSYPSACLAKVQLYNPITIHKGQNTTGDTSLLILSLSKIILSYTYKEVIRNLAGTGG